MGIKKIRSITVVCLSLKHASLPNLELFSLSEKIELNFLGRTWLKAKIFFFENPK